MDLRQYIQTLKKYWWAVLAPVVLFGAVALFSLARVDPVYRGAITFFVRTTTDSNSGNNQFAGDQFAQRRVNSYVALLGTERMAKLVLDVSDLDMSPGEVSGMIGATGDTNTVLLTATVTSGSRSLTEKTSNAVAKAFPMLVNQVENPAGGAPSVSVEVVSGPQVGMVSARKTEKLTVYLLAGLFAGLGLAMGIHVLDTGVASDEQLIALSAGPVLGRLPKDKNAITSPLLTNDDSFAPRAEAFRQLRTNLQFINVDHPVQVIVVTSSLPGEGKSTLTANLGLAMAAAGQSVLLIEADLRRPLLADLFGIERAVGLTDVLAGRVKVQDVLQPWGTKGLTILPSGVIPPNPSELLGSDAMVRLLHQLRGHFDMILIDTPPLLPVTDAAIAATRADGALLVVRHHKTTRQQVAASIESLRVIGAPILGSALTNTPTKSSRYQSYGYSPTVQHVQHHDEPAWAAKPRPRPDALPRLGGSAQDSASSGPRGASEPEDDPWVKSG